MAVEAQMKDDQEQDKGFGQQNQQDSVPTLGGQQSSVLGQAAKPSNPQAPQQAGQSTTQQKGSGMGARLTNLRKYIDSNRNSGMAQGIQKGMETIRSGVQQGIGQSQAKFQEQVGGEKSRLQAGEKLVQGSGQGGLGVFEKGRSEAFTGQKLPEQAQAPDFSAYGQTAQERLGNFGKYRSGEAQQFDIENQAQLENQAQELQKRANLSQSEAGRYQLLRETFNRPAYTTGQQRLDQLLLQAAPEESKALQQMASTVAQPVQQQLASVKALKEAENKAITEQAQALAGKIGTGLSTEESGFVSDINKRIADEQARAASQYSQARNIISAGGDINADVLKAAGVTNQKDMQDFLDYYKKGQGKTLKEKTMAGESLTDKDFELLKNSLNIEGSVEDIKKAYNESGQRRAIIQNLKGPGVSGGLITGYETAPTTLRDSIQDAIKDGSGGFLDYRSTGPTLDFTKYLSEYDPSRITASTVSSADDLARYQALMDLAAKNGGLLQPQMNLGEGQGRIGTFDLAGALGQAREYYNPAEYSKLGRVSAPEAGGGMNLINTAEQATLGLTGGITQKAQDLASPVTGLVPGGQEAAQIAIGAPQALAVAPVTTGVAEAARREVGGVEDVIGGTANMDIGKVGTGMLNIGTAPISGGLEAGITGTQGAEQLAQAGLAGTQKAVQSGLNLATLGQGETAQKVADLGTLGMASQIIPTAQQAVSVGSKNLQDFLSRSQMIATGDIKSLTNPETLKTLSGLNLASDTSKLAISSINKGLSAAKSAWNKASSVFSAPFCFLAGSPLLLENGKVKNIEDVMPNESVFGGGIAYIVGKAYCSEIYDIDGIGVSGGHAIFEDGQWIRVRDSKKAKKLDFDGKDMLVFNMCTENHLMVVGQHLFTDFIEFVGAELVEPEKALEVLNTDRSLADKVQEQLDELFNKKD